MNIELIYNYDKESWIVYLLLLKIKLYCHLLFKGKTECPLNDLACSKQTGDAKKEKEDACQIPFRGKNMKKCRTEDCKKCENQVLPYYSVFFLTIIFLFILYFAVRWLLSFWNWYFMKVGQQLDRDGIQISSCNTKT